MKNLDYIKSLVLLNIIIIACFYPNKNYAQQAGTLDSTFGNNGVIYIDTNIQFMSYTVLDAQNRIVTLYRDSSNALVMHRYFIDGSVDFAFGNNGQLTINTDSASINLLQFQNDERILLAGTIQHAPDTSFTNQSDFFITRFLPDGSLDSTFGNQGRVILDLGQNEFVSGLSMHMDSLILVSGNSGWNSWGIGNTDVTLFRLLPDGSLDSSFAINGVAITDLTLTGYDQDVSSKLLVRPDNKIILSAFNGPGIMIFGYFTLLQYNDNGSLDTLFGNNGISIDTMSGFGSFPDIVLADDLSILVAGNDGSAFGGGFYLKLSKYTSGGLIDSSFAVNGTYFSIQTMSQKAFNSLAIQSDNKIVATGFWSDSLVLMRFTPQGNPDNSFASNGMVLHQFGGWYTSANLVSLIPNDKISVVGLASNQVDTNKIFIARFHNDIFNAIANEPLVSNNILIYPNPANDLLVISFPLFAGQVVTITITDISGKVIYTTTSLNKEKQEVNTSDFVEGMYMVQVRTNDFIETKKLIITK